MAFSWGYSKACFRVFKCNLDQLQEASRTVTFFSYLGNYILT